MRRDETLDLEGARVRYGLGMYWVGGWVISHRMRAAPMCVQGGYARLEVGGGAVCVCVCVCVHCFGLVWRNGFFMEMLCVERRLRCT